MKKALHCVLILVGLCAVAGSEVQNYTVLRRLSSMKFDVSAQLHMVHGESRSFTGTISGDPADITTAKISVKLDPASFDTENEKRDKELREKCLETPKFPFIEFESTSIAAEQKELKNGVPVQATVKGVLRMHGLEKEMTVPVTIRLDQDVLTAEGTMDIVLDEWQILRPNVMVVQLQNDVKVNFTIGGRRLPQ